MREERFMGKLCEDGVAKFIRVLQQKMTNEYIQGKQCLPHHTSFTLPSFPSPFYLRHVVVYQ